MGSKKLFVKIKEAVSAKPDLLYTPKKSKNHSGGGLN
jgi:hypothetical protein